MPDLNPPVVVGRRSVCCVCAESPGVMVMMSDVSWRIQSHNRQQLTGIGGHQGVVSIW